MKPEQGQTGRSLMWSGDVTARHGLALLVRRLELVSVNSNAAVVLATMIWPAPPGRPADPLLLT